MEEKTKQLFISPIFELIERVKKKGFRQILNTKHHFINRKGDIISLKRGEVSRINPIFRDGYQVFRYPDGKFVYVHQLVLRNFKKIDIQNGFFRKKRIVTRHLDDDKTNNSIENLAIGTEKENMKDTIDRNPKKLKQKLTKEQRNFIKTSTLPIHELSRRFNICRKTVRDIRNKEKK